MTLPPLVKRRRPLTDLRALVRTPMPGNADGRDPDAWGYVCTGKSDFGAFHPQPPAPDPLTAIEAWRSR